ncbi:hypothetical protein [Bradyrhizobium betae]|uniref:Uncharacterized protein n=1 Tax=Bradyrhizobium betae TaxID=244734 RepID=A0A5P6NYT7_9BRAD|nr:hypothetical protein [Bradyrhizobium betae]MCS3725523.1 hypothetical protein [Bradyrhizobium betae]QFI71192.1 hypothetical protein F8237_01670 [Bradyrhizobium betae]
MPDDLTLRRTVIGGETAPGDYIVIWDRLPIGRIFKSVGVGGSDAWSWSCGLPNVPQRSSHRGRGASLDAAKAQFRIAWADLQSQISYDQIREARAIDADRSRPWHKRG